MLNVTNKYLSNLHCVDDIHKIMTRSGQTKPRLDEPLIPDATVPLLDPAGGLQGPLDKVGAKNKKEYFNTNIASTK